MDLLSPSAGPRERRAEKTRYFGTSKVQSDFGAGGINDDRLEDSTPGRLPAGFRASGREVELSCFLDPDTRLGKVLARNEETVPNHVMAVEDRYLLLRKLGEGKSGPKQISAIDGSCLPFVSQVPRVKSCEIISCLESCGKRSLGLARCSWPLGPRERGGLPIDSV